MLLVLVPGLLLSTAFFGWSIYRGVYGIIMGGFDEKLRAVSTVSGAFISGDAHDDLFETREIFALSAAPGSEQLLGVDALTGNLFEIDIRGGGALEVAELPPSVNGIALDPETNLIWATTAEPAALHTIDLANGTTELVRPLSEPVTGLELDPSTGMLYAGGNGLRRLNPITGELQRLEIPGLPAEIRAPALDPITNVLYVVGGEPETLYAIDPARSSVDVVGPLHEDPEADTGDPAPGALPEHILALAVNSEGQLLGVADRLVRIDPQTAAVDSTDMAGGYRSSNHPVYRRYVGPLQRIMAKKDITYLYTETVALGGRLTYGIDGTVGENHSVIGSTEIIADNEIPAMERAMVDGEVRLSGLESWEAWGLLKTADAPIYRSDGSIAALASADVDITLILEKTRVALVKIGIVAAITMLFGALVSLFISRKLVSPLTEVKEGALQLAAGRYGHRIADQSLVELRELSDSFNNMSEALGTTIGELTRTNMALEVVRRRRALEVALADPAYQDEPDFPFLAERSQGEEAENHNPSGFVYAPGKDGGRVLLWMADSIPGPALENLRLRLEIAALANPILAQHRNDWEGAATLLRTIFPQIHCLALLDEASRSVSSRTTQPVSMALVTPSGLIQEVDLTSTPRYELAPEEWVVLAANDALAAADSIRRERAAFFASGEAARGGGARSRASAPLAQMSVALFGRAIELPTAEALQSQLPTALAEVLI